MLLNSISLRTLLHSPLIVVKRATTKKYSRGC